jgi:hypothetical protein
MEKETIRHVHGSLYAGLAKRDPLYSTRRSGDACPD